MILFISSDDYTFIYPVTHSHRMRTLVMGAGALGSLVGGLLSLNDEVLLVGRKAHVLAINSNGLRITGLEELTVHPLAAESPDPAFEPELVILTVKSYQTPDAMKVLAGCVPVGTPVLSLQNGLGNLEAVASAFPETNPILGGITSHGVTFLGPGEVRHAGTGDTTIGLFRGAAGKMGEIRDSLDRAGIHVQVSDDIASDIWAKAIVNSAINPLTAILGVNNGVLLEHPGLERTLENVCAEGEEVAKAIGTWREHWDVMAQTKNVVQRTAANRSSMLQDVLRGKRTEIDAICGAIVEAGSANGVACPLNETLFHLVKAREAHVPGDKD